MAQLQHHGTDSQISGWSDSESVRSAVEAMIISMYTLVCRETGPI